MINHWLNRWWWCNFEKNKDNERMNIKYLQYSCKIWCWKLWYDTYIEWTSQLGCFWLIVLSKISWTRLMRKWKWTLNRIESPICMQPWTTNEAPFNVHGRIRRRRIIKVPLELPLHRNKLGGIHFHFASISNLSSLPAEWTNERAPLHVITPSAVATTTNASSKAQAWSNRKLASQVSMKPMRSGRADHFHFGRCSDQLCSQSNEKWKVSSVFFSVFNSNGPFHHELHSIGGIHFNSFA